MGKKTKEKQFEEYGGVTYQDCWGMDVRLAGIISTNLHAFLQALKRCPSCPAGFSQKYGEDNAMKEWLGVIRKMIFAFDQYIITKWEPEKDPDTQERIREGMELFIEHFRNLWI